MIQAGDENRTESQRDEAVSHDLLSPDKRIDDENPDPPPVPPGRLLRKKPTTRDLQPTIWLYTLCFLISVYSWTHPGFSGFWVSQQALTRDFQYWRLVTALAAHSDWAHLLSNMPLFVIFGWFLKTWFGSTGFPLLPLTAGIISNVLTVFSYNPEVRLLGASGMVYSMVGLWIVLYLRFENRFSFLNKLMRATGFSLVLMFPTTFSPQTSYLAHAAGFITGGLLGCISLFFYKLPPDQEEEASNRPHPLI